ncbi:hypothetical protein [Paenibacillus sp.]|uniref:hypothetical protein n=1 Tax=Paenibacillus sp. TaxID=58172 RepID=UPI002D45E3F0|nr:hypothetical protein [Paenibacillus sp.]HZG86397.1 hypothetical protein [Paenibacillus sp.]
MRKTMMAAAVLTALWSGSASAHGVPAPAAAAKYAELTVLVNGVEVRSEANHMANGKMYVSLDAFAALFDMPYTLSADGKQATLGGKTISGIRKNQGAATAWIRDLAAAVGAQQVTHDAARNEIYVLALPAGAIQVSGTVPAMGEHWGDPQSGELPVGPYYGVHEGRLVFLEYMFDLEDLRQGDNWVNLKGMKGVPSPEVVQVDVEYQPVGHPGLEVPHYDVHLYFVSDEEQQKIQ